MCTFIGDFNCKADAKCRVSLPSAFKHALDEAGETRMVVRLDIFEKCLLLFPYDEWEHSMELLRSKINPYNREHTRFLREYQRNTAELSIDSAGRVLIPKRLLDLAEAGKDLTLLGVDKHIEVWDTSKYQESTIDSAALAALTEKILGGE